MIKRSTNAISTKIRKEAYGTKKSLKYFIGYNGDGVTRPLCIKLSQIIDYV